MISIQGEHLIVDLINMDRKTCLDGIKWVNVFERIATSLELTVLNKHIHEFKPPTPPGITAYVLLDASHFSVHTYADYGSIAVDLFSCGRNKIEHAFDNLCTYFDIDEKSIKRKTVIKRF